MDKRSTPAGQLEASFARVAVLQREIERKQRLLGRRIQVVAPRARADICRPSRRAAASVLSASRMRSSRSRVTSPTIRGHLGDGEAEHRAQLAICPSVDPSIQ